MVEMKDRLDTAIRESANITDAKRYESGGLKRLERKYGMRLELLNRHMFPATTETAVSAPGKKLSDKPVELPKITFASYDGPEGLYASLEAQLDSYLQDPKSSRVIQQASKVSKAPSKSA